ncbi:undecaprenyldiphospho-muramoylpentapeptide beta-N-acetylglucosaminyltransferase [Marinimicrobium alkaliphilum]|uniref:undecaprenyldiphospho-muramoylpentapeptide beta-N-acetylglucosaminyltransferase n=1 Tax=Marinimicrobium alkaliphilum TaxID=2202654 RepID=UPI000DB901B0|nr:undecaprenyldiphospho-muramoylpentapeptide beta-N-acetylglucosaminyltransferase [Marinimicrobium alkaliphilum]
MTEPLLRVVIMAGGTGGHVFPALAVARALKARGAQISWLGTRQGVEAELVPAAGFELDYLRIEGVRGRGVFGLVKAPFLLTGALWQSLRALRKRRPQLVVGFGGFASGPGGVAARLLRKPLVIHEQNAIAGTTNRLLARVATRVLTAFPGVFPGAQVVGNPVRADIVALPSPRERYHERGSGPLRVLVLGGSLGAEAINTLMPQALAELAPNDRPMLWHQCGKRHAETTRARYRAVGIEAQVDAFIDDMANAYTWADVVVCRAGALTVSELMAAGVASVLIPLPSAIDDHQSANARILADEEAALLRPQADLTPRSLASLLTELGGQRQRLSAMAEKARRLAQPDAAEQVADHCEEVARG